MLLRHHPVQQVVAGSELLRKDPLLQLLLVIGNDCAAFALELVMGVRGSSGSQLEEIAQVLGRERVDLLLVVHDTLQPLLGQLPLKDLFLYGSGRQEPVREAPLLLPIAPAPRGGLLVDRWVPVGIEEHQAVAPDQVQPAPPGLGREEEGNEVRGWVIEFVHHALPLLHADAAVEPAESPGVLPAHPPYEVEGLGVVGDDDDARCVCRIHERTSRNGREAKEERRHEVGRGDCVRVLEGGCQGWSVGPP